MRISHYSIIVVVTIFYLKSMDIILPLFKIHGKYYSQENIGGHYLKNPKENIIYKVIHSKNYEKPYKLLFKAHGN